METYVSGPSGMDEIASIVLGVTGRGGGNHVLYSIYTQANVDCLTSITDH